MFALGAALPLLPYTWMGHKRAREACYVTIAVCVLCSMVLGAMLGKVSRIHVFLTTFRQVGVTVLAAGVSLLINFYLTPMIV